MAIQSRTYRDADRKNGLLYIKAGYGGKKYEEDIGISNDSGAYDQRKSDGLCLGGPADGFRTDSFRTDGAGGCGDRCGTAPEKSGDLFGRTEGCPG